MSDAKACRGAVSPGHDDLVPGFDPAQKREMGVAVGSVDGGAGLAGVRRTLQEARSKGKRLTTAAREYDRERRQSRHLDTCDPPGVGPQPPLHYGADRTFCCART